MLSILEGTANTDSGRRWNKNVDLVTLIEFFGVIFKLAARLRELRETKVVRVHQLTQFY
jgi:hypothetical protein